MPEATDTLTIGALAAAAAVNVETIRVYQRRGLLGEPERPHRGKEAAALVYPSVYPWSSRKRNGLAPCES
jgi:hypothetical protein